jgi:hypothetical protein
MVVLRAAGRDARVCASCSQAPSSARLGRAGEGTGYPQCFPQATRGLPS